MATTHARMRCALLVVVTQKKWAGLSEIAEAIRTSKPDEMRIRGDGSAAEHHTSAPSICRLLTLMSELRLIVLDPAGTVSVSAAGQRSALDTDLYDRLIQSSVRSLLEQAGVPVEKVHDTIGKIKLPNVPDADSIYAKLTKPVKAKLSLDRFRRLLFLYACAGGIDRVVRIHYFPSQRG